MRRLKTLEQIVREGYAVSVTGADGETVTTFRKGTCPACAPGRPCEAHGNHLMTTRGETMHVDIDLIMAAARREFGPRAIPGVADIHRAAGRAVVRLDGAILPYPMVTRAERRPDGAIHFSHPAKLEAREQLMLDPEAGFRFEAEPFDCCTSRLPGVLHTFECPVGAELEAAVKALVEEASS